MTSSISENHPEQDESGDSTSGILHGSKANVTNNYYSATASDDDLGRLMNFAEQLKEKCEFYIDKIEELEIKKEEAVNKSSILSGIFSVISVFFVLPITIFILSFPGGLIEKVLFASIISIFVLGSFVVTARTRSIILQRKQQIKKYTRKLRSEEVALEETVDLLRDFGRIIADQQGWNELRKIELKLRLSRFEIGRYEISKK